MSAAPPFPAAARPEPGSVRLVGTLAIAGLLSGAALAVAYTLTRPLIEANQARALRAAIFQVVPGAASFSGFVLRDGALVAAPEGTSAPPPEIFAVQGEDGATLGWAIPGEGPGFQDTIRLLTGWDPARGRVIGMQVLESRETPGLGDKIYKDEAFVAAFGDLAIEPRIRLVPHGTAAAPNEVDGITGATVSSRAVVRIVEETVRRWQERLPAAGAPAEDAS